ncbi:MAG TPA: protein kinase [Longimicrobiales bacterium]|nr:protein kinase [Longimicrobiales bacterium]
MSTGGTGRKVCPQCGTEYEAGINFCPKDGSVLKADYGTIDLVGQIIAGRYRIVRKLGEGGMGQVYMAEHVKLGRPCAIKIMRPALMRDQDAIGRFAREAATAGRISHANVAAVYDFGETDEGLIYLAMEHVEGTALSAVLASRRRLPPAEAVEIAAQVAAGLNAAHELSIIHRDLKPDNILLSYGRDGRAVVKVVDFGIAKAIQEPGQNLTQTGMVVGTLEYMSPEQLIGEALDGRSDVYSLGCVLYEMLTGERTFSSPSGAAAALTRRLTEPPPRPRDRVAEVPEALDEIVARALGRAPADRFGTAVELRDALLAAVAPAAAPVVTPGAMAAAAAPVATPPASTAAAAPPPVTGTPAAPPQSAPTPAAATPTAQPVLPTPPASAAGPPYPLATPTPAGMLATTVGGTLTPLPSDTLAAGAPSGPHAAPEPAPPAPAATPGPAPVGGRGRRLALAAVVLAAIGAGAFIIRARRAPAVPRPPAASAVQGVAPAEAASTVEPTSAAASPAPAPGDEAAAASGPTTPAVEPAASPPPATPPARAELRVTGALPAGAVVMLDGTEVAGRTLSLEPGRHTVSVGASGYEVVTWRGTLRAGEKRSWRPELRRVAEAAAPPARPPAPEAAAPSVPPQPKPDTYASASASPAPPAPAAAAATKETLVAAGRRAAEAFVAAINARDIRQLRRAWPGIRSGEDSAWRRFLEAKENESLEARLVTVQSEDVNAGTATVLFPIILTFTNPATGRQLQRPSFEATFLASADGWKLATIRPAQGN